MNRRSTRIIAAIVLAFGVSTAVRAAPDLPRGVASQPYHGPVNPFLPDVVKIIAGVLGPVVDQSPEYQARPESHPSLMLYASTASFATKDADIAQMTCPKAAAVTPHVQGQDINTFLLAVCNGQGRALREQMKLAKQAVLRPNAELSTTNTAAQREKVGLTWAERAVPGGTLYRYPQGFAGGHGAGFMLTAIVLSPDDRRASVVQVPLGTPCYGGEDATWCQKETVDAIALALFEWAQKNVAPAP